MAMYVTPESDDGKFCPYAPATTVEVVSEVVTTSLGLNIL